MQGCVRCHMLFDACLATRGRSPDFRGLGRCARQRGGESMCDWHIFGSLRSATEVRERLRSGILAGVTSGMRGLLWPFLIDTSVRAMGAPPNFERDLLRCQSPTRGVDQRNGPLKASDIFPPRPPQDRGDFPRSKCSLEIVQTLNEDSSVKRGTSEAVTQRSTTLIRHYSTITTCGEMMTSAKLISRRLRARLLLRPLPMPPFLHLLLACRTWSTKKHLSLIEKDLPRTYGRHEGPRDLDQLRRILLAFCAREPGLGYTQGMNFCCRSFASRWNGRRAGFLALHCDIAWTEISIAIDARKRPPLALSMPYRPSRPHNEASTGTRHHMEIEGLELCHFAPKWFLTVFADTFERGTALWV